MEDGLVKGKFALSLGSLLIDATVIEEKQSSK